LVASPETYGGEKPKINTITFRFILDSTVMQANLMGNQGDATATANFVDPSQIEEIVQRNPQMLGHFDEGLTWEHFDFNLDNEWLKDKRVRHAIAYGINREAMVQALFKGRLPVSHTFFGPKHFAHHKDIKKYVYDVTRARQLLTEAGFTSGSDGILRDSRGRRFEISIMTTAGNSLREQVEQIIKDNLRQIGIDLRIDNRPASVLFGQVTRQRTYPHLVMYAWTSAPTTHYQTIWKSTEIPTRENNYVGQNTPGYRNPEVDRLLDASLEELDEAKRRELLIKVQDLWAEDLPSLPLFFRLALNVSRKGLEGYKPRGFGGVPWNAEQWGWAQ
jgi:peptide/nickel transport system substrate-binding protein